MTDKPPLGCTPAWIRAQDRIKELADAISRNAYNELRSTGYMRMWAQEIIMQIDIMENVGRRTPDA